MPVFYPNPDPNPGQHQYKHRSYKYFETQKSNPREPNPPKKRPLQPSPSGCIPQIKKKKYEAAIRTENSPYKI